MKIKLNSGTYELSEIQVAETFKKAKELCPEGWRIPEIYELIEIYLKCDIFRNYEKGNWRAFWWRAFWSSTKEDNIIRRLCLLRNGNWYADWDDNLVYSNADYRVVFIREVKV